jgi:hypothetical protein
MRSATAHDDWVAKACGVLLEDELARRGITLRGRIEREGPCPVCGGTDRFSINTTKQVWNCRGCDKGGDVIDLVKHIDGSDFIAACTTLNNGQPPPANGKDRAAFPTEIKVAEFPYLDANGELLKMVERIEFRDADGNPVLKDGKRKKFRQKRPDPDRSGQWIWNVDGVPAMPYRLPQLLEAIGGFYMVAIVEGEAKVDLLHTWNVPATCCAGGVKGWTAELAEYLRDANVVILPDNDDAGREYADAVGASLQGIAASVRVLELPSLPPKGDIIDWAKAGGTAEQLLDLIDSDAKPWVPFVAGVERDEQQQTEQAPNSEIRNSRLKLIAFDDIRLSTEREYLIKDVIPRTGLVVVWGRYKSGKSFWTFDAVMHIALDWRYRGRRVQQGPVVYCALEGQRGFAKRKAAFENRFLAEDRKPVPLYLQPVSLDLVRDHKELISVIRSTLSDVVPVVVVLDTLNRSLVGSESNDEDMAAYIKASDAIREAFNCTVIIVHHCGIEGSRPRGHTSLTGAADAQLAVERDTAGNIITTIEFMKDGVEGDKIASRLEVVEVGIDEDGEPITSCVVVPVDASALLKSETFKLTGNLKLAYEALYEAIAELGEVIPSTVIPPGTTSVTLSAWASIWTSRNVGSAIKPDSVRTNFDRAAKTLQVRKIIGV